jgi:hypothetical protein
MKCPTLRHDTLARCDAEMTPAYLKPQPPPLQQWRNDAWWCPACQIFWRADDPILGDVNKPARHHRRLPARRK